MLFLIALKNVIRRYKQSASILAVVILGVASMSLVEGFFDGLIYHTRESATHTLWGNAQVFQKGYKDEILKKPWEKWISNSDEIITLLKNDPRINDVYKRVSFHALVIFNEKSIGALGYGVEAEKEDNYFPKHYFTIEKGTHLSNNVNGIMLGRDLAERLNVEVGDKLTLLTNTSFGYLNGVDLFLTGVFYTGISYVDENVFHINIKEAHKLLDLKKIENLILSYNLWNKFDPYISNGPVEEIQMLLDKNFSNLEVFSLDQLDKVFVRNITDFVIMQSNILRTILIVIVLLGIFNIVSTRILGRKFEIGNLKANGESSYSIITLLFFEGIVLGLFASLIGIGLYAFTSKVIGSIPVPPGPGYTKICPVYIAISLEIVAKSFCIGWFVTIFATFFASIRVVSIKIADSLRSS